MRRNAIVASVVVAVACVAGSAPATASTLSASQAAAVNAAEVQAAGLPAPQTAADVRAQAAQIQPAVDRAVASGPAAITSLLSHDGQSTPAVAYAVTKDSPPHAQYSDAPSAPDPATDPLVSPFGADPTAATNSSCYGANNRVWNGTSWGVGGLSWVHIISRGWCGNGRSITWFGGFYFKQHLLPGLCFADYNTDPGGWIIFWSWVHGGVWATIGAGFRGACIPNPLSGSAATIREAANGHWDRRY